MSQAERIIVSIGEELACSRRLHLDDKTEEEVKNMLKLHQNSLYARLCDFLKIPKARSYLIKEDALRNDLKYRELIRY